jgi:hypothetical protein
MGFGYVEDTRPEEINAMYFKPQRRASSREIVACDAR